jgi:hypothetical protein
MKMKTGLWALGLFAMTSAVIVSCGGSSDDDNGGKAGSGNNSAGNSSAGTSSNAGTSSSAGSGNNTAGSGNNTAGSGNNNGGTGNNNGGTGNNNGGTANNAGGDGPTNPGAGGDGPAGCPATQPAANTMCQRGDGGIMGCSYGDQTCRCQRGQNNMRAWVCTATQNPGAGGDNGGFGQATCPANAQDGDACTNGPGLCTGQQCFCTQNNMVNCF